MAFLRENFSRRQTVDLETAMARGLVRLVEQAACLQAVYDEWPDFNDGDVIPSGCVLPDGELVYSAGQNTPTLMEETWEPKGEPGFGLYKLSEGTRSFELIVRTATGPGRASIKAKLEAFFVDPQLLMVPNSSRYGLVTTLDEYFGVQARYTLMASRKLDGSDNAKANIEEATFTIRCEAPHVVVGPVQPFTYKIVATVGEEPIP